MPERKFIMKKINWKSIIGWVVAVFVAGFIIYSNMREQKENAADQRHLVLILGAQTGPASPLTKYLHQGYDLALKDIQKEYGDIIRLQMEDSGGNPQKAITDFHKNKRDNMTLIIELSPVTKAIQPLLDGTFLTVASGVDYPKAAIPQKGIFRIYIDSASVMPVIMEQLQRRNLKRAGIFSFDDDSGLGFQTSFKNAFEKIGGEVVTIETFAMNQLDIRNQVYKALQANPEVIFVSGYGQTYISLFRILHEQGFKGLIVTPWAFTAPDVYQQLTEDEMKNVVIFAPHFNTTLTEAYNKHGHLTNIAYGYDALMLIANAYNMVQTGKASDMVSAMKKIKAYSGFAGNFQIKEDGNNTNDVIAYVIKDGKFIPAESD